MNNMINDTDDKKTIPGINDNTSTGTFQSFVTVAVFLFFGWGFVSLFFHNSDSKKEKYSYPDQYTQRQVQPGQDSRWSSYAEYKFVQKAKAELGWDSDKGDELLKRAFHSENPEKKLEALKEAQLNLQLSIAKAKRGL
jgi:hypothetical protein